MSISLFNLEVRIMKKQKAVLEFDICDLLFKKIQKPKNMVHCKAVNVYDNRYRINVYTKKYDPIYDIDKIRITESYFCKLKEGDLEIQNSKI